MLSNENLIATEIQVDETAAIHLRETYKWAKFLGIAGMIISIMIALAGVFAGLFFESLTNRYSSGPYYSDSASKLGAGFASFFYVLIGVVFFFISIYLYHFGAKMKKALQYTDQGLFNESLLNLKRYYRITGIMTIVYLSFIALALLFVMIAALTSMK